MKLRYSHEDSYLIQLCTFSYISVQNRNLSAFTSGKLETQGLCNNYQEGGAEKLELCSKNLDSTPPPPSKTKQKLVLIPLCYVKNNVAPPSHHPDFDKTFAKYQGAYHIGSKSETSEARKRKEQRKKSKNRRLNASNNRRKRACIIFRSLGGEPVELCYEPDTYGIQQIDSVDEETLLLFTSKTDKLVYEICLIPI